VGGHRQIEHTADLAFEIWGADLGELLQEGARAVVDVLTGERPPTGADSRDVVIDAIDDEDRLVRWLNEVIWLALGEGFVVDRAELETTPEGLRGRVFGRAGARDCIVTEVKSATYHDLSIARDGDRLVATVVMDV